MTEKKTKTKKIHSPRKRLDIKTIVREVELMKIYLETALSEQSHIFKIFQKEQLLKIRKNGVLEDRSLLEGSPKIEEAYLIKDKAIVDAFREKGAASMIWETADSVECKLYFYGRYSKGSLVLDEYVSRVALHCLSKNLLKDETSLSLRVRTEIRQAGAYKVLPPDWMYQLTEVYRQNPYYNPRDWMPSLKNFKLSNELAKNEDNPQNEDNQDFYDNE